MSKLIRNKIKSIIHPILKKLSDYYLSKPRNFRHKGISVKVLPGVFHPGLFFSTKIFIDFLESENIKGKKVLELGAGSGLISIFCAIKNADVTASDISPVAINGIKENATDNVVELKVVLSDLFDNIQIDDFDLILINPPYYPRNPENVDGNAWFCGDDFQYFRKLFHQLSKSANQELIVYMILSEDCQIEKIMSIANENGLVSQIVYSKKVKFEDNYIFQFKVKKF